MRMKAARREADVELEPRLYVCMYLRTSCRKYNLLHLSEMYTVIEAQKVLVLI